jgi:hypothetical protein
MPHPSDSPGHLSVSRAFVVQFDTDTDPARGRLAGRVEHVVSGQAAPFHSLEALLAFVAQLLSCECDRPGESPGAPDGWEG